MLRDALDEWLLMQHASVTGNGDSPPDMRQSDRESKIEELQNAIRQLDERLEKLAQGIDYSQLSSVPQQNHHQSRRDSSHSAPLPPPFPDDKF